jgi:hypothetical protein
MSPQLACQPFVTVDEVLEATCACELNEADHGTYIEELISDASDALYILSGGRAFGRCQLQVWPINVCYSHRGRIHDRSDWVRWEGVDSIPLQGPDTEIIEVTINGVALAPSEYGLLDGNKLFRRKGCWPCRNDPTLTDADDGTFTITYAFGGGLTFTDKRACTELVCQMIKEEPRAISRMRGIVSANVQGVSVQLDTDEIRSLGLAEVNRFMDTYVSVGRGPFGVYTPELDHGWNLVTVSGPSGS